jgi:hypothetical protein
VITAKHLKSIKRAKQQEMTVISKQTIAKKMHSGSNFAFKVTKRRQAFERRLLDTDLLLSSLLL